MSAEHFHRGRRLLRIRVCFNRAVLLCNLAPTPRVPAAAETKTAETVAAPRKHADARRAMGVLPKEPPHCSVQANVHNCVWDLLGHGVR